MSVAGKWQLTVNTPMGKQTPILTLNEDGTGSLNSPQGDVAFSGGKVDGNKVETPITLKVMGRDLDATLEVTVDGDSVSGQIKTPMGNSNFTGEKA